MTPSLSRKTFGNASILTLGAGLEMVLQFLFLIIAGRELGPEEFGFFGYVLAIFAFAQTVSQFGLTVVSVRELAQRPTDETSILAATFRIRAWLGLAFFAIAAMVAALSPLSAAHRAAVIILFAYLLFQPFDLSLLFDAKKLSRWDVPGKLAGRAASLLLLFALWRIKGGLTVSDVALCSTVLVLVSVAVGWRVGQWRKLPLKWWGRSKETASLMRVSAPVVWSNAMTIAYTQSQTIFMKWFSSPLDTGYYALTSRLLMPVLIFRGILYRVTLPIVSEVATDREALTARLEKIFPLLGLIFMPVIAFGIPAISALLVPVFGDKYAGAVIPLQISISMLFFTGAGAMIGTSVLAAGDARTPTIGLTIGCMISLISALVLIPSYGAVGGAWSAWLGEVISTLYPIPKFLRQTRPRVMARLLRIAAASACGPAAYYVLRIIADVSPAVALIAAVVVMALTLGMIGEISPAKLRTVKAMFKREPAPPTLKEVVRP
jgi:O-antigen/teichoic acid export membrane protein